VQQGENTKTDGVARVVPLNPRTLLTYLILMHRLFYTVAQVLGFYKQM